MKKKTTFQRGCLIAYFLDVAHKEEDTVVIGASANKALMSYRIFEKTVEGNKEEEMRGNKRMSS